MIEQSNLLSQFPNLKHGFTSKSFGVIRNVDEQLPDSVIMNRHKLADELDLDLSKMMLGSQPHGNEIMIVTSGMTGGMDQNYQDLPKVDGFITNITEYTLIASSADCVPVLLYDSVNQVISSVHAGWKGASKKIVQNAVKTMQSEYNSDPKNIFAVIGPAICGQCYDNSAVSDDRLDVFNRLYTKVQKVVLEENGKISLDIPQACKIQLSEAGIPDSQIERIPICTLEDKNWASYRRNPEELDYSVWSFIGLMS
jgi:polyphenol oxidase